MADASEKHTRIIAVAVDHSEWSEQAFECEYKSYVFFSIHAAGVQIKSAVHDANKRFTDEAFCFDQLYMGPYVRVSCSFLWTKASVVLVGGRFPAGHANFVRTFNLF